MIVFYSVCLIIAAAMYLSLYLTDLKRSLSQHLMLLCIILCNGGMLAVSVSETLSQAILGNNIVNLGAAFEPVLYFMCMCEVCHVTLSRKIKIPMVFIQLFIMALSFTGGVLTIYYSQLNFFYDKSGSFLEKIPGPLFFITLVFWAIYIFGAFFLGAYCRYKNKISRKQFSDIWVNTLLAVIIYGTFDMFNFKADSVALLFILLSGGMINAVYPSNMFAIYENREITKDEIDKTGFISFDRKVRYRDSNAYAQRIFADLSKCERGALADKAQGALRDILTEVYRFAGASASYKERMDYSQDFTIKVGENTFEGEVRPIYNFRRTISGYAVIFRDVSEHFQLIEINEKYNEMLETHVEEKTEKIRIMQQKTILGIAQLVESRDLSTGGHIKRTSDVVKIFTDKLQQTDNSLSKHFLELVIRSAPMHDLGKIGVEDAVLQKQAKFLPEEYEKMKKHAQNGERMLRDILADVEEDDFIEVAANVAHYHHERVDGSGYPEGLTGENIPIEARIMALADVFDALVSKRCYKEAFSYDEAFDIISKEAGTHFDEKLARVFISCRPELEAYYNRSGD